MVAPKGDCGGASANASGRTADRGQRQATRSYDASLDTIQSNDIVERTMSKRPDPESLLPLTPGMFQVLIALADGEKHGYAIIKEVDRRAGGQISLSARALYTI